MNWTNLMKILYRFSQCCGSETGAFLTPGSGIWDPGSGIGFFRIPDLGSQTHIFESLVTTFWIKSSIIL
jgi:hypothetical protein